MERTASCPSCRRGVFPDDPFCSWCGTRIRRRESASDTSSRTRAGLTVPTAERLACPSCNTPALPGDVFCATCGARQSEVPDAAGDNWATIPQRIADSSNGKYQFVRELGRGGMGIVFLARDTELDRNVAIKVLSPTLLLDEAMVSRFQQEARTIASLRHESIVTVYGGGRAGNLYYFVMDYIEGVSLSDVLRRHGRLPIPIVEAILYRVGLALSHAHRPERRIIHRDIKPSNIMLDTEGHAIVMDFGISKVSEKPTGLTVTGLVMGTPEYMSPEQCRGHTVTHESDQYSLGAVAYAMLTGAPPFTGPFYQVLMAHQFEPVPLIREVRPDCPPALTAAVERMLAKVPGDRWPGILDALRALGLRPLAPDDPVIEQIGGIVRGSVKIDRASDPATGGTEAGQRTPTSIRIMPHPEDLEVGDEMRLTATALFADGAEEAWGDVSWGSTDPAIARVDLITGQLVAMGPGSAVITAAGIGVQGTLPVEVAPPRVVQIAVEPERMAAEAGTRVRFKARPQNKRGLHLDRNVSWSSSDPRTAAVSQDGSVTANKAGMVSILAHCEGAAAAAVLEVTSRRSDAITPSPTPLPGQAAPRAPHESVRPIPVARSDVAREIQARPRTWTTRVSRVPRWLMAALAAVPVLIGSWLLLRPPSALAFGDFAASLERGEVARVEVRPGALDAQVGSSGTGRVYRVPLAGVEIQSLLADLASRGVAIVASGTGTVQVASVWSGSNERVPDGGLELRSPTGGCSPCDAASGVSLDAGWYTVSPFGTQPLDSLRVGVVEGPFADESLAGEPLLSIFVLPGATLELTAAVPRIPLSAPNVLGRVDSIAERPTAPAATAPPASAARPAVPAIATLLPAEGSAGLGAFSLTVRGRAFTASSIVLWDGSPRPTRFVSATELQAQIASADVVAAGRSRVSVRAPESGTSQPVDFVVSAAPIAAPLAPRRDPTPPPPAPVVTPPRDLTPPPPAAVTPPPTPAAAPSTPTDPPAADITQVRELLQTARLDGTAGRFQEAFRALYTADQRIQTWVRQFTGSPEVRSLASQHSAVLGAVRNQCTALSALDPSVRCVYPPSPRGSDRR